MQCDQCKYPFGPRPAIYKGLKGTYCSPFCRRKAEAAVGDKIADLSRPNVEVLAYDLYCLATHKDCPQWVRDSAEAIFNDLTK